MQPLNVVIVAMKDLSPLHFSVSCIILSDKVTTRKRFEVQLCVGQPGIASSQDGFPINAAYGYEAMEAADTAMILWWGTTVHRPSQSLLDALNRVRQNGAQIVGLHLGMFVLSYAGLLDGKQAAMYWEFEQGLQACFPVAHLDINALYAGDDDTIILVGTAAALDCCLYVTRQRFGSTMANQTVRRMIVSPHREGGQAQFIEQPAAKNTRDQRINVLLDCLCQHLHEPHNLDELAQRVMMSRRTLTRHFMKAIGSSVTRWSIVERLRRSQTLLESSQLPVRRIAEQVGFQSPVTWCQHFKPHFGVSPAEWRKTFRSD